MLQCEQRWSVCIGPSCAAEAASDLIPQADVVAITGSALINHTLDRLLSLAKRQATVPVLGPSTPLSPVLFEYGASINNITDPLPHLADGAEVIGRVWEKG